MQAKVEIDAGVCGFHTTCRATSEDSQFVTFAVGSGCEKIRALADRLKEKGPVDAYQEIGAQNESVVLTTTRATLKGCCAACAAPIGIFKAMQVAAGLALPMDIALKISKE